MLRQQRSQNRPSITPNLSDGSGQAVCALYAAKRSGALICLTDQPQQRDCHVRGWVHRPLGLIGQLDLDANQDSAGRHLAGIQSATYRRSVCDSRRL